MIGHDDAWRQWREAMAGGRMHHAWLLTGKKGLGKAHFARAAARMLVGAEQSPGEHPDILTLTQGPKDEKEEKKRADGKPFELARSIRIAQIRAMQQRLTTRPTAGERRAIIVDPADDLERNAANALLKNLEEPPVGTVFLLVAHQPSRLLPTIRSRCRMLRFPALPDAQVAQLLQARMPGADHAAVEAAVRTASGSIGAAIELVDMDLGQVSALFGEILSKGDRDFALRGSLAEAIGTRPDRQRQQAVFDLARSSVSAAVGQAPDRSQSLIEAHGELVRLGTEASTYNYDAGLLAMEIGTLLARAAPASERANG